MRGSRISTAVTLTVLWFLPAPAMAQAAPSGLLNQMYNLFSQSIVLAQTPGGNGIVQHTAVYQDDPRLATTINIVNQVSQQIGSQLSLVPLGSSSGGFTYAYDATLGAFQRSTQTFGPAFAERATTIGRAKFSFGVNSSFSKYNTLDGKDLQAGDIKFDLYHQRLDPPSFVEGDVVQAALVMNLTSSTTAFLFNYGVSDRIDVGLAVPIVHVSMDLTYHATILDFATHAVAPGTHQFANGTTTADFNTVGSATGLGDVVLRGKYNLLQRGPRGVAVALDLRLPTGDENNMLGSGSTQAELYLIGSTVVADRLAPHVNLGYTFAKGGIANNDQVNYVGGVEFNATPKLTVIGDVIGRTLRGTLRLNDALVPHQFQQGNSAPIETTLLQTVDPTPGNLTSALIAAGVKFNPGRSLLISAHVLVPVNDAGLRSRITPVVGFDYSF